jgi:cell division protein FtsI/penicillin-binding protein 2
MDVQIRKPFLIFFINGIVIFFIFTNIYISPQNKKKIPNWEVSKLKVISTDLNHLVKKLSFSYKDFGILVIHIKSGTPLFIYNKELISQKTITPGSTIKVFTLLSLNEKSILNPAKKYNCPGWGKNPRKMHQCWFGRGHGQIKLADALAFSCNFYFRQILQNTYDTNLFLGKLKEFQIIADHYGVTGKKISRPAAIGLGNDIQTKAYKLLYAYNAFFNDGKLYDLKGKSKILNLNDDIVKIILSGMKNSYQYGTSNLIKKVSEIDNGFSKTGTGMYNDGKKWHRYKTTGLALSFFPANSPKIGILVIVKRGMGSGIPCRLTGEILKKIKYIL